MRRVISLICTLLIICTLLSGCGTVFATGEKAAPAPTEEATLPGEESALTPSDEATLPGKEAVPTLTDEAATLPGKEAASASRLTGEKLPFYMLKPENKSEIDVYYVDEQRDIPYISTKEALHILEAVYGTERIIDPQYKLQVDTDDNNKLILFTRENKATALFNFNENSITFVNYNLFFKHSFSASILDNIKINYVDEKGRPIYFKRGETPFERNGKPLSIKLNDYDIEMIYEDGMGYLPLQTFSDIFLSRAMSYANAIYNGEFVAIATVSRGLGEFSELYYKAPTGNRSKALIDFNYDELCLVLDISYGLREIHDIESFDKLFLQTDLAYALTSENSLDACNALNRLAIGYLGDLHSSLTAPSYLVGENAEISYEAASASLIKEGKRTMSFKAARAGKYPGGVPFYEEVGNTAYITFDSFVEPSEGTDYYKTPPTLNAQDTLGIIIYAHSQITRENSPIENVVLDLSLNIGGAFDAAVYTLCWFLGEPYLDFADTLTGAQETVSYKADVNLDYKFDEKDTITDKNLYCLISEISFSCGNLVPSVFKTDGNVKLIGNTSGGGSCVVQPLTSADGNVFNISSSRRISTNKNGAYYDVDRGVDPDYPVTKISKLYDREALTNYINQLF